MKPNYIFATLVCLFYQPKLNATRDSYKMLQEIHKLLRQPKPAKFQILIDKESSLKEFIKMTLIKTKSFLQFLTSK